MNEAETRKMYEEQAKTLFKRGEYREVDDLTTHHPGLRDCLSSEELRVMNQYYVSVLNTTTCKIVQNSDLMIKRLEGRV